MKQTGPDLWCVGCGVEIIGGGYAKKGELYCCQDCATGWACECRSLMEMDGGRQSMKLPAAVIEEVQTGA